MSAKDRSIKQRLSRAKAPGLKLTVATDWASNWEDEQRRIVAMLGASLQRNDAASSADAWRQLDGITGKRFAALPGVLSALADAPDDGGTS